MIFVDTGGWVGIADKNDQYAKTRLELKKKGKPIPENDLWIASVCIEHKIPLCAF